MQRWIFEPGHTSAGFMARHMMVAHIRGQFGAVHGWLEFDPEDMRGGAVEARIDATGLWTGEPDRDGHLKSEDFLDVARHPEITFRGTGTRRIAAGRFEVEGELTIRGRTRPATLDARYLGVWSTPFWEEGRDRGPIRRVGFEATTRIDRHDFGVSWNAELDRGGIVVSDDVWITLDVEALEAGVIDGVG